MLAEEPHNHGSELLRDLQANRMSVGTTSSTDYGHLVESHILARPTDPLALTESPQVIQESFSPSPSRTSAGHTQSHDLSHAGSSSGQRTLDDVRDQVAQSIAIRTIQKAEVIDSTKAGVVITIAPSSDPFFLRKVASKIKHALLTSSYLFAVSTTCPPGQSVPLLICGASEEFVGRAALLIGSKFVGRLEPSTQMQSDGGRWLGMIRDLGSSPYDEVALWDVVRKAARSPMDPLMPPPGSTGIDQMLAHARARLERITPQTAYTELTDPASPWPAVLVDIRPQEQREREGGIGGALVVERNVLEWRFDPRCAYRLPVADRYDLRVIVFCSEGYTSSLAAAALHDLGLLNATDVIGGYKAWRQAGLPSEIEVVAMGIAVEDYWSQSRGGDSRRGSMA